MPMLTTSFGCTSRCAPESSSGKASRPTMPGARPASGSAIPSALRNCFERTITGDTAGTRGESS